MEYALLWYELYSKYLKSQGILINPYDMFISKITIKDNQFTISWYVYDSKVLHVDEELNTNVIETIAKHFVNLTVSRGKKKVPGNVYWILIRQKIIFIHEGLYWVIN